MNWQLSPGGLLSLLSGGLFAVLAAVVWRRRESSALTWLALVLVSTAMWSFAYTLELVSPTASARHTWGDLKYVGICTLPAAWVAFVLVYTGSAAWLRRRTTLLLLVEPLLVLSLLGNASTHDLIRYYPGGPTSDVSAAGPLFWPHSIYTYALLWGATAVLVVRLTRLSPLYRRLSVALVLSFTLPFVLNVLFNLGIAPFNTVDLTPFAFLLSGLVLVWGVLRFRLVRLQPVGRSQAFMSFRDPVFTLDPLGRVIDANPAAAAAFGAPAEKLVGRELDTLLPRSGHLVGRGQDGTPIEETIAGRLYEIQPSPVSGRNGRSLGTLVMAHDVTEQRQAEKELAETSRRYRLLAENASDFVAQMSPDRVITWVSPSVTRTLGWAAEDLLGTRLVDLVHPDDVAATAAHTEAVYSGHEPATPQGGFVMRVRARSGQYRWMSGTVTAVADESGVFAGVVSGLRDVDDLVKARAAARSMIESSLDPLVAISPEGLIADANEAMTRVTGIPRESLIGTAFSAYFTDPVKANAVYLQAFEQGTAVDYPLTMRHRDGTLTEVMYNASTYRDAGGNVLGVFAAARDVTTLMQTQKQLQSANETILGFTAAAAHDLRSPLVAIAGFSALLTKSWETFTDENRRKFVGSIDHQAQNMSGLVDDLSTSATIEGGGLTTSPELIVVAEAIEHCLELGGSDTRTVEVSCSPDLSVRVDPHHLGRILDNYVQNAFKYGEPSVRIEATRVGDMVQVRVLDHGPGVPPEFEPRLFDKFARADTPATKAKKGTGLGLSIVRGLAEANGGQARYEPNVPHGSCFIVELPAGDRPEAQR